MTQHIFFSWQSDTDTGIGRNLIERALERAIGILNADADIDPADRHFAVDRDTIDVPGSPPIVDTIFGKIDRAAVFLSDVTYVAKRADGRRSPNPNVLLEHGWALKALTWRGIIAVMNVAMGNPDEHPLPFDLQHFRRPILFECAAGASEEDRRAARDGLTKQLVVAIRAVLTDDAVRPTRLLQAPVEPHPHDVALLERVRKQFSPPVRLFLRQHDFGTPFRLAALDPIRKVNEEWIGAGFEFQDPALQKNFAALQDKCSAFGSLVNVHIFASRYNAMIGSPKTDEDLALGMQKGTFDAIKAMNGSAAELSDAIDAFDRLARDRIRVVFIHPDEAAALQPDPRVEPAMAALQELAGDEFSGRLPEIVRLPRLTLRMVPLAAMDGRRLEPAAVTKAQRNFPPIPNEQAESGVDGRQWWSCGARLMRTGLNPETKWRMRLVRPGLIEYEATFGDRIDDDREILVAGEKLEALVVRNLERMASILIDLGLGGPAFVSIALQGTEDIILTRTHSAGRPIRRPGFTLPTAEVADLSGSMAEALHEQFDILWQTAGWGDGSLSFGSGAWEVRDNGER